MPPRLLVVLCVAFALAGCGTSERAEESRIVGEALTVYSSAPLSGPLAAEARDVVRAEKLALEEAGGRAAGYRISFVSLDSADPKTGRWTPARIAGNARTAVEDLQTIAYLGELEPGASAVSLPILNAGGMLQVSTGDTLAGLTEPGAPGEPDKYYPSGRRTFARTVPSDDEQVDALLRLLRGRGARRVALADDRGVAGAALADRLGRRLRADGVEVVARERLDPEDEVPEDLARDVREARADAFVYGGTDQDLGIDVLRAVHAGAPQVALLAGDAIASAPDLPARAGAAARRLLLTALEPAPAAEQREFADRFRARYGSAPAPRAVLGYTAMRLVLGAIDRAGEEAASRPAVIREALRMGGSGSARFVARRIIRNRLVTTRSEL